MTRAVSPAADARRLLVTVPDGLLVTLVTASKGVLVTGFGEGVGDKARGRQWRLLPTRSRFAPHCGQGRFIQSSKASRARARTAVVVIGGCDKTPRPRPRGRGQFELLCGNF